MKNIKRRYNQGQAIITAVVFFLVISVIIVVGISSPIAYQVRNGADFLQSKQGYIASDTLAEEGYYRLNKGRTLPATFVLSFSGATSTAVVTDVGGDKQIIATGNAGAFSRVSKSVFTQGAGISINYGLQVGNGGVTLSGSSGISGNVYSNGNISASGSCSITGSATAAVSVTQFADQSNSASGTPAIDMTFGTTSASQDFAQSFTVSTTTTLAQVGLYIRKVGTPSNATIKINTDTGTYPNNTPTNTSLASGTLSASSVTTSYGWVNIAFTTNPSLVPGTVYWLVIDNSSVSTSNYYTMAATTGDTYTAANGVLKRGQLGGSWTTPNTAYDAFFQIYLGGVSTISGVSVGGSGGDVRAFSVTGTTASGNLYCQTGSGNNKSCDTSQPTPSPLAFPVSDSNIADWKAQATALGVRNGSLSIAGATATTTAGMKIIGNLDVSASGDLTLTGPLYVTGDVTISGAAHIRLASSYGASSGYIVTDGKINISASGGVVGSGNSSSYIVMITTSGCGGTTSCSGASAITVSGAAGAVVLISPDGKIDFSGSASAKGAIGYGMSLTGNTWLYYDSGLADINFSSGPSGSWNVSSWQEISQ